MRLTPNYVVLQLQKTVLSSHCCNMIMTQINHECNDMMDNMAVNLEVTLTIH
jgi:hypothetical protein